MKKRLILCCDGTWNSADQESNGRPCPTNVIKIAYRLCKHGADGTPQIIYYDQGVGTGNWLDRIEGGATGLGLEQNIHDAYIFLLANYDPGDDIYIFGFSRGAYTARSIGGMIRKCGILKRQAVRRYHEAELLYHNADVHPDDERAVTFRKEASLLGGDDVPVKMVGVWDTVGALGIPGHLDDPVARFFQFHNTDLGVRVENAFHALAIDEHREDFIPTLWTKDPQAPNTQNVEQVWFAGAHANIGGGYEEHGLSDISLAWMADRVAPFLDLDPSYLETRQDRRDAWAMGRIYNSATGLFGLRDKVDRPVEASLAAGAKIHESVAVRFTGPMAEAYDPPALHGGPKPDAVIGLGAMEQRLRWPAADPAHLGRVRSAEPGFFDRLLRDFVIG